MIISIESIKIRNFKGIRSLDVEFGQETNIYAANALGKTTIFDAFTWTLFGKDSLNSAAFEIKALDQHGQEAHNLEHSVECSLSLDGRPMVFKRVYQEKWTKPRGKAKKEFSGHTTDFFIDGVPMKEKDYQARMQGLIDEGVFRLLTDPRYFNEVLHWQKRRELLMTVCGDVSVQDVIQSDASLAGLSDALNGHGIEDAKKILLGQRKEINEQLEKIPVRIDEANRSRVDVRPDIERVPGMIASREAVKAGLESKLTDARNGGALSQKRIEMNSITAEIQERKNAYERDRAGLISPLNKDLGNIQAKAADLSEKKRRLENEIRGNETIIQHDENGMAQLRDEWTQVDAETFTKTFSPDACTCPACGQKLPENQVNAAREKHEAAKETFNKGKATKLTMIETQGREIKARCAELQAQVDKAKQHLAAIVTELPTLAEQEHSLQMQIAEIRAQQPDTSDLESKKVAIQTEIDNISTAGQGLVNGIETELWAVQAEIKALNADLSALDINKKADERIQELTAIEKTMAAQLEEIEGQLYMVENFYRAKVNLLEGKINAKFGLARFKLFEEQINGGLQEVCETTLNGVPYSSMNNAGRVQVGLDIIRTLQAHYGIIAPVFVDNAEAIVEIPPMSNQVIKLIVSANDKTLRIETSESKKAA